MDFIDCVARCAQEPELVANFNRLSGCNFGQSLRRTPLEVAIDEAAGYGGENPADMAAFIAFVYDCIWSRLPPGAFCDVETEGAQ